MRSQINVVVTCANRKTREPIERLMARNLPPDFPARIDRWLQNLQRHRGPFVSPVELYAGDHWRIARGVPEVARGGQARLWILSAGYGLIPSDAPLAPYSATFAPGQADSVVPSTESDRRSGAATWWRRLAGWRGPKRGAPRSLGDLVDGDPGAVLLVVASPYYLAACSEELHRAYSTVSDTSRFMVLSAGAATASASYPNLLAVDARLQNKVEGSRGSLNVRVARHLLEEFSIPELRFEVVNGYLSDLSAKLPDLTVYDRAPCSDGELRTYIERHVRVASTSASALLRKLRDDGRACEQGRFGRLFREVVKEGSHVR